MKEKKKKNKGFTWEFNFNVLSNLSCFQEHIMQLF